VAGNLHPREDAIPLRVTTLRSLSYCWLLPRLPRFCRLHPHIRLDLQSDPAFSRFEEGGPEVGIRYGQGAWPGLTSHHLMDDELFPVASPSLPEVAALQTPAQIAQLPLLSDMSPQGWRDWFRAAQVRGSTLPPMHTFNDSTDAMRAAVYGLGAVLARKHIAQPYLQRYELVRLPGPTLKARYAYYIVHPSHRAPSPAATVFIDWLKREALDERTPMPALPAELLALPTGETAHAPDRRRRSRRAPATE
jgi:DNA-binding transcriptional LysR family regulator